MSHGIKVIRLGAMSHDTEVMALRHVAIRGGADVARLGVVDLGTKLGIMYLGTEIGVIEATPPLLA